MISLTQWQMPPHRYSLSHNDICTSVSAKVRSYLSRNRLVFWRLLCLFPSECEMGPNSFVCLGEFCLCFSYSSGLGGRGKLKVWQVYSQWFWMSLLASTLQSTGLRTPFYDRANIGDDPGHIYLLHPWSCGSPCSSQITLAPWWWLNTFLPPRPILLTSMLLPIGQIQIQSSLSSLSFHAFPWIKSATKILNHYFLSHKGPLPCTSLTHTLTHPLIHPALPACLVIWRLVLHLILIPSKPTLGSESRKSPFSSLLDW